MKKIDHYRKLLGVAKEADLKELKSVYRNQMKDWHPDKFHDKEEVEKVAAEKKSKTVIEAYHFLVSIAPETVDASFEQYNQTLEEATITDFEYKNEVLRIDFSDGHTYEYFDVPKASYIKLVNAPSQSRFVRRHISEAYVYRSINKIATA